MNARGIGRRWNLKAVVALVACSFAALACLNVGVARAADMQTHSIEGLNYTLPADWEQVPLGVDDLAELAGVDAASLDQVADLAMWSKNDGAFVAIAVADPDAAVTSLDDLEFIATYANLLTPGTLFEGLEVVAATDQGYPALVATTDHIALNGVTYALTVELFYVDSASFQGLVAMSAFLPASGTVSEDLDSRFDAVAVDTEVSVGDISFTVPAGSELLEGYFLGVDFVAALADDGVDDGLVFAINVPFDFVSYAGRAFTVADLQEFADQISGELGSTIDVIEGITIKNIWVGAYNWLGMPTLGLDASATDGDTSVYVAVTASYTDSDLAVFVYAEPDGSAFADVLFDSFSSTNVTSGFVVGTAGAAAADEEGEEDEAVSDAPGFVVGFSAADGARDA